MPDITPYIDAEQLAALKQSLKGKRHQQSRKVELDGFVFDSQAEASRYQELEILRRAGKIWELRVHPVFIIQDRCKRWGKTLRQRTYTADFQYWDVAKERYIVEDVKGSKRTKAGNIVPVVNDSFHLRFDVARFIYPDFEFVIVLC